MSALDILLGRPPRTGRAARAAAGAGRRSGATPWWAPASVGVGPRHLELGEGVAASLAVIDYPSEVGAGWLEPLVTYPGRVDVAVHIEPVPAAQAASSLRKQRARFESTRRRDYERGRLDDPEVEAAAADARELAYRIARGEGRLFRVGIYLTVYAPTEQELAGEVAAVRAVADGMLLRLAPATYRQVQGWTCTLPVGLDPIGLRRTLDTAALAAAFPFTSPDLTPPAAVAGEAGAAGSSGAGPSGVLYGTNLASAGLVIWDRFAADNFNSVILARSGAGKSYLAKLDALRNLYQGVQVAVVDPEDEYVRLADAVGGTVIRLGDPRVRFNPLDLPTGTHLAGQEVIVRRALFLHTLVEVLLGEIDPAGHAALDRAVLDAYRRAGISADERTHARRAPLLADVAALLQADEDPAGPALAARLAPYTSGSFSGLFAGPTTTRPDGHLVVFSLRELADELKPAGTLLTLDAIWRRIDQPDQLRRRLVVIDEAWQLMQSPAGARFLFRMAKASRKRWAGLSVVSQDAGDLLGTDLGRAVVANAATQILLRQAPQVLEQITRAFGLSAGEREFLASAGVGEGLLAAGTSRVAFAALASRAEAELISTDPQFLAERAADGAEQTDADQDAVY